MSCEVIIYHSPSDWMWREVERHPFEDSGDAYAFAASCTDGRQGHFAIMRKDGVQVARFPEPNTFDAEELRRHHLGLPSKRRYIENVT